MLTPLTASLSTLRIGSIYPPTLPNSGTAQSGAHPASTRSMLSNPLRYAFVRRAGGA